MSGYYLGQLAMLLQLVIAIGALTADLPKKDHHAPRVVLAAALLIITGIATYPLYDASLGGAVGLKLAVFAGTLASCTAAIMVLFEATLWQAIFCCTAGYAIQNLASGTASLMRFLAETYCPPLFVDNPWYVIPSTLLVYPPYFFLFARNVRSRSLANNSDPEMILIALATVFAVIGLDVAIKAATSAGISAKTVIIMRVAHGFVCTFILYCEFKVLYGHQLKTEQAVTSRLLAERERQYQLSRENIEAINIKCHDIRHQIRKLANTRGSIDPDTLEDISQEVNVYELTADTGNEALDTILTEKGLACYREGIGLTFMADGSAIDFMAPADIYSFFGNAIDNAIEAVRQVTNPERRIIDVRVERRHEMASILIENCYDISPVFVNGIPRTSKGDEINHGFGIRSMQLVAAHYGGTVQVNASDGIFSFSAILMRPE